MALKQEPADEELVDPDKLFESVWFEAETVVVTPDTTNLFDTNAKSEENNPVTKKKPIFKSRKCPQCDFTTVHGNSLKYHMLSHTDERPYPCEYCDFSSKYPPILKRHINSQHADLVMTNTEPELFTCKKCDYKTPIKQNLKSHVRKHKKDKQFKCTECSYATAYKHNFVKHNKSHDASEYKCDKCPFVTRFYGHITRHMEQIHNEVMEKSKHICEYCQTTSKEKWKLRRHKERSVMTHTIKCEICEFETMYRCQMRKHRRTHLDDQLDSSFAIAAANAVVIEPNVVAQDADKSLEDKPKESDSETAYKCDKCSFETRFHGHIIRHLQNIHNEVLQSNHICEYCNVSWVDAAKLKQHKERGRVKEALKCVDCNFETHYKCQLKLHKEVQHRGSAEGKDGSIAETVTTQHIVQKAVEKPADMVTNTPKNETQARLDDGVRSCDKCPFKTLYEGELTRHVIEVHSLCKFCGNCLGDNWTLNMHMLKSKTDYFTKCTYCDFGSYYRCELRAHVDTHFTELCGSVKDASSNFDIRNLLTYPQDANMRTTNPEPPKDFDLQYPTSNPVPSSSQINEITDAGNQIGQSKFGHYLIDQNCVDWRSIQVIECNDSINRYKCPLCDFPSKFKACVQRHFQRHHTGEQNRPYRCVNCDFATKTKDAIALHNKRNPISPHLLNCKSCNYTTNYKCAYTAHQKMHYIQKCTMCNAIYKQRHELVKHIAAKHLGKGLRCFYCNYVSLRKDSMASHILTHTGERPFKCSICNFGTIRRSLLDVHMQKKHKVFRRDMGVTFINKSKIDSLRVQPTEPPPAENMVEPEPIPQPAPTIDDDDQSIDVVRTPGSQVEFQSIFQDDTVEDDNYADAVDMLEDVKPIIIEHFVEVKPSTSTTHVATEFLQITTQDSEHFNSSDDEPLTSLQCDICDYSTRNKNELAAHIRRTHDSKKRYKCVLCPYRTAQRKYLIKHKEMHKKTSFIYKCNWCTYKTKFKSYIMKHLNVIHNKTVKTKYMCVYCNTSTVNKNKLEAHRNRNRCKKSMKCAMCNFETIYKCQMKKHKQSHFVECKDEKDETLINPNVKMSMYTKEKITKKLKKEDSSESDSSSDENMFKCEKCDYETLSDKQMSKHFVKVHNGCQYCGRGFDTNIEHDEHVQNSKAQRVVKCFICDFDSDYKCETIKHMSTHFTNIFGIGEDGGVSLETKLTSIIDSFIDDNDKPKTKNKETVQENKGDADGGVLENPNLQVHQNKFGNYLIDPNCIDFRTIKIKRVNRDAPFECPACEFKTKYRGSIERHIQRNHASAKNRPFKCVDCGFATSTKDSIRLHNSRKLSRKILTCSQCKFTAKVKCVLALHQKEHYALKCVVCKKNFSYKRALVIHFASVHLKTGLKCKFCDFTATARDSMVEHESTHTGVKPFQCGLCSYATCRKRLLENHFKSYHTFFKKRKAFKREKCDVSIKTEDSGEKIQCSFCTFSDTNQYRLNAHIKRKHTSVFMCEKCPYTTPYKGALKSHSFTHQNHYVYKCKKCPYETFFKGRMMSHLIKLHNNKPQGKDDKLICELCGEKQRSAYMLKMHQEKNKYEENAKCSLCGFQTTHKCHMDRHEKNHFTGDDDPQSEEERMYTVEKMTDSNALKCRFCNFFATKRSTVAKHESYHSSANPFRCNICGHVAKTKVLLMVHWKKFHKHESVN